MSEVVDFPSKRKCMCGRLLTTQAKLCETCSAGFQRWREEVEAAKERRVVEQRFLDAKKAKR